ncbi:hypothetical protein GT347_21815 [Xylophilus rhododendri]|uniref:Uncharacterized protein n=1 Tax=Xylophilus rhododendri TaxID=2697032 RepID=A0A857JBQ4_9BURK|nr:hypothetical protein [Xylophilus rhododendri]QHJ00383.1 hypothetical protein GT347_21815 [Xylophilus rhododendri]
MRTPIHARGFTFFPKAGRFDGRWQGVLHILEADKDLVRHRCVLPRATEFAALMDARSEALSLATSLRHFS